MGSRTRALLKRGILGASLALLVLLAPALLLWSRGNVGRVHLGMAALCALALSALGAVLGASTRKGIWFALLLALGLSSTGLGFLACRYRQRADRVPDLWRAPSAG
jgi:lipopolysaccharide export LptBFGC system permease protein LptF